MVVVDVHVSSAQALRLPAGHNNDDDRNPLTYKIKNPSETNPLDVTVFCRIGMTGIGDDRSQGRAIVNCYWYARHCQPAYPLTTTHIIPTPTYYFMQVCAVPS